MTRKCPPSPKGNEKVPHQEAFVVVDNFVYITLLAIAALMPYSPAPGFGVLMPTYRPARKGDKTFAHPTANVETTVG